jgi:hypothetical protein
VGSLVASRSSTRATFCSFARGVWRGLTQPEAATVAAGAPANLQVVASGATAYKWFVEGSSTPGAEFQPYFEDMRNKLNRKSSRKTNSDPAPAAAPVTPAPPTRV